MSNASYTSGCFCGAVQVELTGEPVAQAYCHCGSCRGWLGAPIHAATLWPTPNANVVKGAEKLGVFKKTEASHRHFCTVCGSPVLIRHPSLGMTDVPAGTVAGLAFQPSVHVHYGEKVLPVRDGLPKLKNFPKEMGGSGEIVPE
jgi:hypothetical protein